MPNFRIAAAQVASLRGKIEANISAHAQAMAEAGRQGVSVLVFPELSLTGYEIDLARELAMEVSDSRLDPLHALAQQHGMDVVVGAPLSTDGPKPSLGAILLTADGVRKSYAKMHLGTGEEPFFDPGSTPLMLTAHDQAIGIAICADSSQPSHAQHYATAGASTYAAGVFLNAEWYEIDVPRLESYAAHHRLLVVIANHGASVGTYTSVGRSAVWGPDGKLLAQAAGVGNCLVMADGCDGAWRAEVMGL